jgi:hypothetical protein
MVENEQKKERILVVKDLPTQEYNKVRDEKTGEVVRLMTIEEALTELLNK